jgi:hypothetical protein
LQRLEFSFRPPLPPPKHATPDIVLRLPPTFIIDRARAARSPYNHRSLRIWKVRIFPHRPHFSASRVWDAHRRWTRWEKGSGVGTELSWRRQQGWSESQRQHHAIACRPQPGRVRQGHAHRHSAFSHPTRVDPRPASRRSVPLPFFRLDRLLTFLFTLQQLPSLLHRKSPIKQSDRGDSLKHTAR